MKKYLLLLLTMLTTSLGAWADATISCENWNDGAYTNRAIITSDGVGSIATKISDWNTQYQYNWGSKNCVSIVGNINQADITALASITLGSSIDYAVIDLSGATISGDVTYTFASQFAGVRIPVGDDLTANYGSTVSYVMSSGLTGSKSYAADNNYGSNEINLHINKSGGIQKFINAWQTSSWCVQYRTVNLTGDAKVVDTNSTEYSNLQGITGVTVNYTVTTNDPYTVSGCNVIINMAKAEAGKTFAQIVAEAKAAMTAADATKTSFCSLTVQYAGMTNADLAVLGDADVAGATRIDLSGVTLASGASIDNLQLPSSLTSLVLPKDQTVSSVLAGKLEAAGNVNYAYSPSSDAQRLGADKEDQFVETKNLVADYVWVVKAGGLAQAFTNEEPLRNSFYIKVASSVALNNTDVNFDGLGDYKPTNYLFLDFSASNLTPEMAANYRVTDQIGYHIILPNDWSVDDMAVFAALPQEAPSGTPDAPARGNLAAVFSYSGTTLKIMEITDGTYVQDALKNPRIVRYGTTAIEVVGKLVQVSSESWNQYGDLGAYLIAALNQADDAPDDNTVNNIKTININVGQANTVLTEISFTNTNIEHFIMSGVKNKNNATTGPGVIVSGCTNLQTIDVSNSTLQLLDAHGLTNLTSVNMSGTLMTNANGLSGETILTGCTSLTTSGFVTNSSTQFLKDLKLINTGLTSFATPAKVTGDIYLNATPLTSLDLTTTQFQNTTSKIHIHATDNEEDNDPIATLNSDGNKTISVTNKFNGENNVSPRIHPFTDIADNISEAAASGDATVTGCNDCKITYDAAKGVATVHAVHEGHFADLMKALYAGYPQGTTFKFDKDCVLNLNDMKALCGTIYDASNQTYNDMNWRSNYYYVDLFDVPATEALCKSATFENNVKTAEGGVIYQWIEWMRENDRQVKGLILPKDHTRYGSGTTLIKDGAGTNTQLATCSEFIAYYKTKDEQGNSLDKQTFVGHVYNQTPTNANAYQASYEKMLSLVDAHTYVNTNNVTVPEVKTDADIVLITSNSATKLNSSSTSISGATRIETINNEMVGTQTGKGSIYAYPNAPGDFATACASTNLKSTPTELLQINGAISDNDITAINSFTNGPRVLDLRYANTSGQTGMITKAMLEALTNTHIEYILLPEGQTKDVVCGANYTSGLKTSLKAVISSTSTNCVAYVKTAGSLAEARYLATGGSVTPGTPNIYSPAKVGLTSVTLAGNLNAADIGCNLTTYHTDDNGHWKNGSGDEASVGLSMETGITSIDLADAVFVNKATDKTTNPVAYADMNLSWAGLANLSDIKLPTNKEMKDIPESCCEGLASLKEICIPSNYEKIHNAAFLNTIVEHITTTDAAGALVDNGPNTYTLSANLKQVGDAPEDYSVGLTATQTVFPQNRPVFDCYVLATKTPICYKNAFPANMLYGWGGFKGGDFPYCRDKYVNGTNYFCVLRFPSEQSYDAVTNSEKKDDTYELMQKQYTDVTKVYSKKEQTGAVDANGKEITWPTFSELRRAYNQATEGITWNRWEAKYDSNQEVNGGDNIPTKATDLTLGNYTYDATARPGNNNLGIYEFTGYEGWHQFTLSQATYVEPDEKVVEEKVVREYQDAGWFTICLPYDLTEKQVIEWLGVPQSEGNVICKYKGEEVDASNKIKIPDIRQLNSIERHTSTGGSDNNKVTFRLTSNLYNDGAPQYMSFDLTAEKGKRYSHQSVNGNGSYNADTKVCLKGGIPYIIYAYKRKDEKIKGNNIGQYIMTRYGDQFKQTASCINSGEKYYEYLGDASDVDKLTTLKFAKPYEEHQIVAMNDAQDAEYLNYDDNGTPREYRYAFVGQFWNQKLPKYCFYQSKGTWYRNGTDNEYQWSAYKCVIMAVPTITTPNLVGHMHANGNFRNNPNAVGVVENGKSFYPTVEDGTTDKLNGTLKIVFADGRDDDDFPAAAARYSFAFDDDIVEYDDMGNEATAIDMLDGEDITPLPNHYKVYNMSGQYVGNSVNGLAKGMYVVNGKKYVIK